jgi:rieske iron-sulfur protein
MIVSRRGVLIAAAAGTLPDMAAPDRKACPQIGDGFVADADARRTLLRSEAIKLGNAPILAWPSDRAAGLVRDEAPYNQVLLLRVLVAAKEELVAFSAICPHAACVVSVWVAETLRLRCPCHGSEYDPARSGAVLTGPAPYPLPTLPIRVLDDVIVVDGTFSATPGGHTSRTM